MIATFIVPSPGSRYESLSRYRNMDVLGIPSCGVRKGIPKGSAPHYDGILMPAGRSRKRLAGYGAGAVALAGMILFACAALAQDSGVIIRGEVKRPGTYTISAGEKLSSLIERAGGFSDNAWLGGGSLVRKSDIPRKGAELQTRVS